MIKRIVITGGTYSGKTTTINALKQRGFCTVPEAAIEVIKTLQSRLGNEAYLEWRTQHPLEFQTLIWEKIIEIETSVENKKDDTICFYDRGVYDGFAYGPENDKQLVNCFHRLFPTPPAYSAAFVLDTLPDFQVRANTGRMSTKAISLKTNERLKVAYRQHCKALVPVQVMDVKDRVDFILNTITKL